MIQHQELYREAIEQHQEEGRAWARERALSQQARARKNASRQLTKSEARPVRRSRLRRLVFQAGHTTALAILLVILI